MELEEKQRQAAIEAERQAAYARREAIRLAEYERERRLQEEIDLDNALRSEREAQLFRAQ